MIKGKIIREKFYDDAIIGKLYLGDMFICLTLEKPYLENKKEISSIPTGNYNCFRIISPHFGITFEIRGVRGRGNILFHSGNTEHDSKGCVILGMKTGILERVENDKKVNHHAVLESKIAFSHFMTITKDLESFNLVIENKA